MMSTAMLMGPKVIGLILVLTRAEERKAFGGTATLLKGAATEAFISMITAPLLMASNTRVVFEVLLARDAGWTTQARVAGRKTVSEAAREHRWEIGLGDRLCGRPSVPAGSCCSGSRRSSCRFWRRVRSPR